MSFAPEVSEPAPASGLDSQPVNTKVEAPAGDATVLASSGTETPLAEAAGTAEAGAGAVKAVQKVDAAASEEAAGVVYLTKTERHAKWMQMDLTPIFAHAREKAHT